MRNNRRQGLMKKILMPFAYLIKLFGKLLRLIWGDKFKKTNRVVNPDQAKKEDNINFWVGVAGIVIPSVIAFIGIISSSNDMEHMEQSIEKSFARMEQLDYLAHVDDDSIDYAKVQTYQQLRGKVKTASTMMRSQIEFNRQFEFSETDDFNLLKKEADELLKSTSDIQSFATEISKEVVSLMDEKEDKGKAEVVCRTYKLKVTQAVAKREVANAEYVNELNKTAAKMNMRTFVKQIKKVAGGKLAMEYATDFCNELEILYEFLVAIQLYEMYGKDVSFTSIDEVIKLYNNQTK